jgi:hypothetical protein
VANAPQPSKVGPPVGLFREQKYRDVRELRGIWRDEVYQRDASGQPVLVEKAGWNKNLIVVGMPKLLAALMKNHAGFSGILQHAQGRGDPNFDITLPVPSFNSVALLDEYFRKAPDEITFVDEDGNPTLSVTNSILIKTTLDFNEANGAGGEFIREQGIFGGDATGATDSGVMVNLIFHKSRFKDSSLRLIRFIQFIF